MFRRRHAETNEDEHIDIVERIAPYMRRFEATSRIVAGVGDTSVDAREGDGRGARAAVSDGRG